MPTAASFLPLLLLWAAPARAVPAFTKEPGVVVSSAVIQGSDAAAVPVYPVRLYYIRGSSEVFSATTPDGLALTEEAGVRLSSLTVPALDIAVSSITGLSVLPLNAGGFRMAYSVIGSTGDFRIYTATSADGLAWSNDTGTAVNIPATFAGLPSLVKLQSGDWRMYFIRDFNGGNQPAERQIFSALSINEGRNWSTGPAVVAALAGEVAAMRRTDNRVRLIYSAPLAGQTTFTTMASALSSNVNGTAFALETGVRLSTPAAAGSIGFPFIMRSTDTFRWRLYYTYSSSPTVTVSTADAFSATTDAPDPRSISPSKAFRNQAAQSYTITGEIFDPAVTALLSQGAGIIPGAGLVYTDDQTLTVTFNTQNQNLGPWDLTLANSNAQTGSLTAAVLIDFQSGSLQTTDNLLRPRQGGQTKIDINVFNAERTTVKLYTTTGNLVSTLLDGVIPIGTTTIFWDGRNSSGNVVASGVYVLKAIGPHLNVTTKIVVIK